MACMRLAGAVDVLALSAKAVLRDSRKVAGHGDAVADGPVPPHGLGGTVRGQCRVEPPVAAP